jgi:hypothetical protein
MASISININSENGISENKRNGVAFERKYEMA